MKQARTYLAMWCSLCGCAGTHYILPVADGGPAYSPAAIQGQIVQVTGEAIVVGAIATSPMGSVPVVVPIGGKTELFTVYGGHVARSELLAGQKVRVWFHLRGKPKSTTAPAAVIMLASTDPKDEWP